MFATRRKLHGEEGQGLVEYSLILLMVALVVVAGLTLFGGALNDAYTMISGAP